MSKTSAANNNKKIIQQTKECFRITVEAGEVTEIQHYGDGSDISIASKPLVVQFRKRLVSKLIDFILSRATNYTV